MSFYNLKIPRKSKKTSNIEIVIMNIDNKYQNTKTGTAISNTEPINFNISM